jgi:hypothetical protein
MIKRTMLAIGLVLGWLPIAANAQNPTDQASSPNVCWMAGLAFSPGATARVSDTVMICQAGGAWFDHDQQVAAGCFFEGKFYSTGARKEIAGIPAIKAICIQNGTWREFGAGEQPQGQGGARRANQ